MTDATLRQLHLLCRIQQTVLDNKNSMSWARIKKLPFASESELSDAVDFGVENGYLSWSQYNIYKSVKPLVIKEESFYDASVDAISELWASEKYNLSDIYIENTSRKDSKIEGPWTRPDITLISYKKFPWTIGHEFDVVTFEVKTPEKSNVLAVFEALSHLSNATRAYVVFPSAAAEISGSNPAQALRVREECLRHGVGLIVIEDVFSSPRAIHAIKAARREVDHEKCSSFLDAVISPAGKNKISAWK